MIAVGGAGETGNFSLRVGAPTIPPDDFALGGVVRQSDGKLVAAGYCCSRDFDEGDFAVPRYNVDGSLDTSFSGDGRQSTDFGGADFGHALALQPDGKLIVAGRVDEFGANDWGVVRYTADGSLDTSFGVGGKVVRISEARTPHKAWSFSRTARSSSPGRRTSSAATISASLATTPMAVRTPGSPVIASKRRTLAQTTSRSRR
jgi:uncharacterized delta-60 repeat protein